jgi:DNA polymerase-3 subunit alpha/error-prone DNA polymerase
MGFYSPRALIADAQRHGVEFRPVDVQLSDYDYTIEGFAVRTGLRSIGGLKEKHIEEILAERALRGPYASLGDLVQRNGARKETLMRLAAAGALSAFGMTAREALWKIQAMALDKQSLFFGQESAADAQHLPPEDNWDRLQRDYATKGFSLTQHPMGILRPALKGFATSKELGDFRNGGPVRIAGLLALLQRPPTAKGFAFLTCEDETGSFNVILMPQIYEKFRGAIGEHAILHICGYVQNANGVINIRAETVKGLPVQKILNLLPPSLAANSGFDFTKCLTDHSIG